MPTDLYVIRGLNLRAFVLEWLADLEGGGGQMRGLLAHINDPHEPDSRYGYGAHMMMANIAPQAVPDDAPNQVTLFYAVMALYQQAHWPNADPRHFDGFTPHVERAFDYFWTLGEAEAARQMVAHVIRGMKPGPKVYEELRRRRRDEDPAKAAAHEREMTMLEQRDLRAAELLDPDIDFDTIMLSERLT